MHLAPPHTPAVSAVGVGLVLRSSFALLNLAVLPSPHITLTIPLGSPLTPLTPDCDLQVHQWRHAGRGRCQLDVAAPSSAPQRSG